MRECLGTDIDDSSSRGPVRNLSSGIQKAHREVIHGLTATLDFDRCNRKDPVEQI